MRWACLLALFGAACGTPAEPTGQNESPILTFSVTGMVRDSILGTPVAGIRVLVGDSGVVTNADGRFATRYREGRALVEINDLRFEPFSTSLTFMKDEELTLLVRGQAPYVIGCVFRGDSVSATMIDLQGRKTINRRAASYLLARASQSVIQNDANSWHWNPIDNLTWLTNVPLGSPADSVDWSLEDADGNARFTRCVRQPPPCQGCGRSPRP